MVSHHGSPILLQHSHHHRSQPLQQNCMDVCTVIHGFSVHENSFTPRVNNYGLRELCNIHKIASDCAYMFFYRIYLEYINLNLYEYSGETYL